MPVGEACGRRADRVVVQRHSVPPCAGAMRCWAGLMRGWARRMAGATPMLAGRASEAWPVPPGRCAGRDFRLYPARESWKRAAA